jgi:hypothetical protein
MKMHNHELGRYTPFTLAAPEWRPHMRALLAQAGLEDITTNACLDVMLGLSPAVFITGAAGTAKSTQARLVFEALLARAFPEPGGVNPARPDGKLMNRYAATLAYTGNAANICKGSTMSSFFGLGVTWMNKPAAELARGLSAERCATLHALCFLLIDEISLVSGQLLDHVDALLRHVRGTDEPFGGVHVFIAGDFSQVPPLPPGNSSLGAPIAPTEAFQSSAWLDLNPTVITLTKNFRSRTDATMTAILPEMRAHGITRRVMATLTGPAVGSAIDADASDLVQVVGTREAVDFFNDRGLEAELARQRGVPTGPTVAGVDGACFGPHPGSSLRSTHPEREACVTASYVRPLGQLTFLNRDDTSGHWTHFGLKHATAHAVKGNGNGSINGFDSHRYPPALHTCIGALVAVSCSVTAEDLAGQALVLTYGTLGRLAAVASDDGAWAGDTRVRTTPSSVLLALPIGDIASAASVASGGGTRTLPRLSDTTITWRYAVLPCQAVFHDGAEKLGTARHLVPITASYGVTIQRAQGSTMHALVVHAWSLKCSAASLYTAVTRVTHGSRLKIVWTPPEPLAHERPPTEAEAHAAWLQNGKLRPAVRGFYDDLEGRRAQGPIDQAALAASLVTANAGLRRAGLLTRVHVRATRPAGGVGLGRLELVHGVAPPEVDDGTEDDSTS